MATDPTLDAEWQRYYDLYVSLYEAHDRAKCDALLEKTAKASIKAEKAMKKNPELKAEFELADAAFHGFLQGMFDCDDLRL